MEGKPWYRKSAVTDTLTSLIERAFNWVPVVIGIVGTGGFTGWAAYTTAWLNNYGRIAWVGAALIGAIAFMICYWLWQLARMWLARRQYYSSTQQEADQINPLEDVFDQKKIDINSFSNPFDRSAISKTFTRCHIYGPAVIYFVRSAFLGVGFVNCDFVEVKTGVQIMNVITFENSTFRDCKLYGLSILVAGDSAKTLRALKGTNWLN